MMFGMHSYSGPPKILGCESRMCCKRVVAAPRRSAYKDERSPFEGPTVGNLG